MTDHKPHWSKDVEYVNPMTVFPTYVRGELVQVAIHPRKLPTIEEARERLLKRPDVIAALKWLKDHGD